PCARIHRAAAGRRIAVGHPVTSVWRRIPSHEIQKGGTSMPALAQLYFKTAIVFLIIGIAAGIHMSISGDHEVTGAHAHTNLLGWVTMALFGAYLTFVPEKARSRLARIQYGVYTFGVAIMMP